MVAPKKQLGTPTNYSLSRNNIFCDDNPLSSKAYSFRVEKYSIANLLRSK